MINSLRRNKTSQYGGREAFPRFPPSPTVALQGKNAWIHNGLSMMYLVHSLNIPFANGRGGIPLCTNERECCSHNGNSTWLGRMRSKMGTAKNPQGAPWCTL